MGLVEEMQRMSMRGMPKAGSFKQRMVDDIKLSKTESAVRDNRRAQAIASWHISSTRTSNSHQIDRELVQVDREVDLAAKEELAKRKIRLRQLLADEFEQLSKELEGLGLVIMKDYAF
eukprot:Nk52_evm100s151 gene=Nk52_evmTU100s151